LWKKLEIKKKSVFISQNFSPKRREEGKEEWKERQKEEEG